MAFLDIFTTLAGGGATGFIGTIASSAVGTWKAGKKHNREMEILDKTNAQSLLEMNYEKERRGDEIELDRSKAELGSATKILLASYEAATKGIDWRGSKLLEWAELIRVTFRPNVGYLLIFLTALIYFTTSDSAIQLQITLSILSLTGTVIGWFFGSRELNKKS